VRSSIDRASPGGIEGDYIWQACSIGAIRGRKKPSNPQRYRFESSHSLSCLCAHLGNVWVDVGGEDVNVVVDRERGSIRKAYEHPQSAEKLYERTRFESFVGTRFLEISRRTVVDSIAGASIFGIPN
jgi:hypothetical protein